MSIECLAVLGIKNEPLYLYAPGCSNKGDKGAEFQDDVFGFSESEAVVSGLPIGHEVRHTSYCMVCCY
jgi:hypothetical protein